MEFRPPPRREYPSGSDYAQQWSQGLQQLGNTFAQTAQARQQQERQAMLDKYLAAKEGRETQQYNYEYRDPLISPNPVGAGPLMNNPQQMQESPLVAAHKLHLQSAQPQASQPSSMFQGVQDNRDPYMGMSPEMKTYSSLPGAKNRDAYATAYGKFAQADWYANRPTGSTPTPESFATPGIDINGNIIQVGSKSGTVRTIPVPGGKIYSTTPSQDQGNAAIYGQRANDADTQLQQLIVGGFDPTSAVSGMQGNKFNPNFLKSENVQAYEQAKRNFLNATLRRESGATISPAEREDGDRQYFPVFGDDPKVLEYKARNRAAVRQGLETIAGPMAQRGGQGGGLVNPLNGRPLKDTPANRAWVQQQGGQR